MGVAGPGGVDIRPTLAEVREVLESHDVAMVEHELPAGSATPASILRSVRRDGPCFLLESADDVAGRGRFAYVGAFCGEQLRWSVGDPGDPYELAAEAVFSVRQAPVDGVPFAGGAVGYFGYDLVRTVERLPPPPADPLGVPDLALLRPEVLVVHDAELGTIRLLAEVQAGPNLELAYDRARARIGRVRRALAGPAPSGSVVAGPWHATEPARFRASVDRVIAYVEAGDAFQVVPSQRWAAELTGDAFAVYEALREINPSPYMYYLDFGDFQVAGASPEPLLEVRDGRAMTMPIAGTRSRGRTAAEDRRLEAELLSDDKERAEHTMLVDLGRNDLGRVCEPGTVVVERLMDVRRYSHVMHVVSTLTGRLRAGVSSVDALRSMLPAGTLSGAPKVRAMEIIDELEPVKRGPYGGAVGYLAYGGDLETAIHIRTAVIKDGHVHVQAGAGVVADSDPSREHQETVDKVAAVMGAVEAASARRVA